MKISAQEEYGLRCLLQLATLNEGESLTLPQIAGREGISVANAGKLMWLLNKANFVKSTRGTKGGYALARPAEEIRLNEVIKVLDRDILSKHCESYTGVLDSCVHNGDCGIRPVIVGLHEIVQEALSKITLAQLLGSEESVDRKFHQIQGLVQKVSSF
jgi:Rrf2 family transcriptional regulator, iron-sulfur cluster assembly transcription factor